MIFTFGKYKGQEVEEIIKSNPGYCKWIYNQPFTNQEVKDFIADQLKENIDEYFMGWGKYKNKTLTEISKIDEKYIDYLKNNQFVHDNNKTLLKELEKF